MSAKRFSVKDQKLRTTKRKKKWWKVSFLISGILFFVFLASYASFASFWSISSVSVEGSLNTEDTVSIQSSVLSFIEKPILGIFSGQNSIIFSKSGIVSNIKNLFPIYGFVKISRTGLDSISITLVPRSVEARVCTEVCFFADETGFVFSDAKEADKSIVSIFSSSTPAIGSFLPDTSLFKEILFFINESSRIGLPIKSVYLRSYEVEYSFESGGNLIVEKGVGGSRVLSVLEALKKDPTVGFGTNSFMSKLDYILIGQGNKVVFKMK